MADDFFASGGGPGAFSWANVPKGAVVTGILAEPYKTQQQRNQEGEPLFWPNKGSKPTTEDTGRPVNQAVLTLQTEYEDFEFCSDQYQEKQRAADAEDDGRRRLFVSGGILKEQLVKAMQKAGVSAPEVGATIAVKFVGKVPAKDPKFKANNFEVRYERPTEESLERVRKTEEENDEYFEDDSF